MKLSDFFPEMEGFEPVESPVSKTPQIPTPETQVTPFLRAPLPLPLQYSGDTVKQYNRPGLSSFRIAPLPPGGNPAVNSAAKSAVNSAINSAIAAIPPTVVPPSTDLDIISAVNNQHFGSFDAAFSNIGSGLTTSVTGTVSGANEIAVAASTDINGTLGGSPGAGWSQVSGGVNIWTKSVPAGSLAVNQTVGTGSWVADLAMFVTTGATPTFTGLLSGSRANGDFTSPISVTPTAGHSILGVIQLSNAALLQPEKYLFTDSAGNTYNVLASPFKSGGAQLIFFYAQNVPGVATTISWKYISGDPAGTVSLTFYIFDVSNIGNTGLGSYTFQASDSTKMVEFTGQSGATATLPSTPFTAGWQTLVSNVSAGNVILTSTLLINNKQFNVTIPPGGATWVFCDGSNYFTSFSGIISSALPAAHMFLSAYDAATGLFTQTRPAFPDISGSIAIAQMANGTGANSTTFFRGDNQWIQPDYNSLFGATGGQATAYGGFTLVSAGLIGEVAKADLTAQGAAIGITTIFTTPSGTFGAPNGAGMYEITWVAKITQTATTSSVLGGTNGFQILYTDKDDSVVVTTPVWWGGGNNGAAPTSASLNTTQTYISGTIIISAKANTIIQYKMDYTSVGATPMQFNLHIKVNALL